MDMDCGSEPGLRGSLVSDRLTLLIWMVRGDGSTVLLSTVVAGADGAGLLPLTRSLRNMIRQYG